MTSGNRVSIGKRLVSYSSRPLSDIRCIVDVDDFKSLFPSVTENSARAHTHVHVHRHSGYIIYLELSKFILSIYIFPLAFSKFIQNTFPSLFYFFFCLTVSLSVWMFRFLGLIWYCQVTIFKFFKWLLFFI